MRPGRGREPGPLLEAARAGDRAALARLLSLVERGGERGPRGRPARLPARAARPTPSGSPARPGAGKSTLTSALIGHLRGAGRGGRACWPSTRRRRSPAAPSSATGCACRTTPPTPACSSARWPPAATSAAWPSPRRRPSACSTPSGKPWIIVETVGVGQVEVEVAGQGRHHGRRRQPGLGRRRAGQQGRPDGDRRRLRDQQGRPPGVAETRRDLELMLDLSDLGDWRPPIVAAVATDGTGVADVCGARSRPTATPSRRAASCSSAATSAPARGAARDRRPAPRGPGPRAVPGRRRYDELERTRARARDRPVGRRRRAARRRRRLSAVERDPGHGARRRSVGAMADELVHLERRDDGVAVVTLDNPKVNALSGGAAPAAAGDRRGARRPTRPARWSSPAASGSSPPAPTSREFGGADEAAGIVASFHERHGGRGRHPPLGHRRGGRLRPRRRVRAGAGLRLPDRLRAGRVRPARDPARHHPRRRRHAAAAAAWSGRHGPRT